MSIVHFITHPEVTIDPAVPVPDWTLSPVGTRRMQLAMTRWWPGGVRAVFSSAERKARDAADIMAGHLQLSPVVIEQLGENDRSATGYLPPAELEAVADQFFAFPDVSARGWNALSMPGGSSPRSIAPPMANATVPGADAMAVVAHGGVGALLLCHLKGVPISRRADQPGNGGGNVYTFDAATRALLSGWRRDRGRAQPVAVTGTPRPPVRRRGPPKAICMTPAISPISTPICQARSVRSGRVVDQSPPRRR